MLDIVKEHSVINAQHLGKVAVVMGGANAECEISMSSGMSIVKALQNKKIEVDALEADNPRFNSLIHNYDRVFIAMHGVQGEGGQLQAMLSWLNIPYTGSSFEASSLAMNKCLAKHLWKQYSLPTPEFICLSTKNELEEAFFKLGQDIAIKPARDGSTFGISKVDKANHLLTAYQEAKKFDEEVFAESWVRGTEYTVAILNGEALPSIKIQPKEEFYNYLAKYKETGTKYSCPSGLSKLKEQEIRSLALQAFNVLGCKVWGRVDLIMDDNEKFWLLEVNTVPGMTPVSLFPKAAKQIGLTYEDIVEQIILQTLNTKQVELIK